MTVAVMVKVFDGIVLATDSATTAPLPGGSAQVYNNANKVFQLHRRLPIGAFTWGLGSIDSASIETLAKDLRARLMGRSSTDWTLDSDIHRRRSCNSSSRTVIHGALLPDYWRSTRPA